MKTTELHAQLMSNLESMFPGCEVAVSKPPLKTQFSMISIRLAVQTTVDDVVARMRTLFHEMEFLSGSEKHPPTMPIGYRLGSELQDCRMSISFDPDVRSFTIMTIHPPVTSEDNKKPPRILKIRRSG